MKGNVYIREKGTHQAHVIIGCKAYDINHPLRTALYLLNNLLGHLLNVGCCHGVNLPEELI